jgi:hypothetical protein
MPYTDVGDYMEQIGLSPPATYHLNRTCMRQTKVASSLDTMSKLSTTTLAWIQGLPVKRGPSTRESTTGTDDKPISK